MSSLNEWFNAERAGRVVSGLEKKGFEALYAPTREEALKEIMARIPPGAGVGVGGSVTIRELGLIDMLKDRGHRVFDHWEPGLSPDEVQRVRKAQVVSDVFITSTNAITIDGKMVNIDHSGNRVAAMIFGPGRIIVVAGVNKIVRDVEAALDRVKNYVSPLNNHRRNDPNPCAKTSFCADCSPPSRLCRVTAILEARPKASESYTVIIVGESLGY